MRNFRNVTINTSAGPIKIVSKKEFLSLIPIKHWLDDQISVDVVYKDSPDFYGPIDGYIVHTKIKTLFLDDAQILYTDFVDYISIRPKNNDSLVFMVEDIAIASAMEMGYPTHLFRLDKRTWIVANPEDFAIYINNVGKKLVNYKPKKSICWKINK